MKKIIQFVSFVWILLSAVSGASQGWVAEVDLDFNHNLYALENITNASVTFSGVKVSGSSPTSQLQLVIRGEGLMSGEISLNVNGLAIEPYDQQDPGSEPISASFSGKYTTLCETGFFQQSGETANEQIYLWITIYPRMEISDLLQTCDELQLTTRTCSPSFLWEVNDELTENFKIIPGKTTASITITRNELVALGFANPSGRKYFRVTGLFHTTSHLQPVDIYYSGPSALLNTSPPKCHNGNDGSVRVDITTNTIEINDFVVTLFELTPQANPIRQDPIVDGSHINLNDLSAGKYMVRVENNSSISVYGSCWSDHLFELTDPHPVTIASANLSDYNGYQVKCFGASDGRIEIKASGGTNVYEIFEWTPSVSTTAVAENLAEGDYHIRVKDSNHCWSKEYNYTIHSPGKLGVHLQSTGGTNSYDVSCINKKDGEILTDAAGGVKPYSFQWSDGSRTENLMGLEVGTYKLLVTDDNGCTVNESIELLAPDPISFKIAEISSVTCPGGQTGELEITSITNTIGDVEYSWSSGENQNLISGKPSGTYTATVTDAQGCTGVLSFTLPEPLAYSVSVMPSTDFNGSQIRCDGEDNGAVIAIVRDENGVLTSADSYTWTKNGVDFASGINLSTISDLTSGVYGVKVIYRTICSVEQSVILRDPEPVSVAVSTLTNYNGVPISCFGEKDGSIIASASGGTGKVYNYLWDGGETTRDLVDIGAGTYHIIVTDINDCKGVATKILEEPQALRASIAVLSNFNGQPISCSGAADARLRGTPVGGTPPFTYHWSSGHAKQELTELPAGNYRLEIRDVNGCTAASEIIVTDPSPVRASFSRVSDYNGYNVSCTGKNDGYLLAQGSGGTEEYTFKWEGSLNTNPLYESLRKGNYTVIVTDANGCSDLATGLIREPNALSIRIAEIKHVSCNKGADGEIHLDTSGGAGDYEFSAGQGKWQNQPVLASLVARTYDLTVQDANNCFQTVSAILTEPPAMVIDFTDVEPARCGDAGGRISASITGGTGSYQYVWRDSRDHVIGENANISGLFPGIYTLLVTDDNYCKVSRPAGVTSLDGPKAILKDIVAATCADSRDGKALAEILEGQGPFSYEWSDGQQTALAENLEKGIYLLQIIDANDCVTIETVTIPGPDPLEIVLAEKVEPACHGSCDGKLSVTASGGHGSYSFMWQGLHGSVIDKLCAGDYAVTVSDEFNCNTSAIFEVRQPEALTAEVVTRIPPHCPGQCDGQLKINGRGGTGELYYQWNEGLTGPVIKDLCSGSYTTRISDANDCRLVVSYTLEEPKATPLQLGGPLLLCKGQTHTLDAGPAWQEYSWTGTTGFRSNARQVTLSDAGVYVLEAVDLRGCLARDTFSLDTSDDLLKANFLMAAEAMVGDTVVMIDISWPLPENIAWIFPDAMKNINDFGDIVHGQFDQPGNFDITLKASLGECKGQLTKSLIIIEEDALDDQAGRIGYESFVKEFTLFANPNDGAFDVIVELAEESPIILTVWSSLTSRKIIHLTDSGSKRYFKHLDLRPLSAGSYTLRLDYAKGTRNIRFIVR